MKITRDPDYRSKLLDQMRGQLSLGKRREGVHVSDLIMCARKSWAEKKLDYVLEASDKTVLTFMRGLSHEEVLAEGFKQVSGAYCLTCQQKDEPRIRPDTPEEWELCPRCGDTLLTGTIDWVSTDDDLRPFPVEMKSTLKSSRSNPENGDMMWFIDQLKSYMFIHSLPKGKLAIFYVMGNYSRQNKDIRDGGPPAELVTYELEWDSDEERAAWGQVLKRRKQLVEGDEKPPLDDVDSPAHPFICDFCVIGKLLPDGSQCENYPWDENEMRKGSKAAKYANFDTMVSELMTMQERMKNNNVFGTD